MEYSNLTALDPEAHTATPEIRLRWDCSDCPSPTPSQQTFAISDGGDDVYTQQNGSVYPPDGNVIVSSTATLNQQARSKNGSNNQVSLGWLRFDTSALPDNAIVTGATLELYQKNVLTDTDSRSLVIDWQDPSIWPIATGDHTNTSPAGDALDLALASVNGDALNSFALTGADTNVDVTGETALTLGVDGGQATGINRIDFATLEHSVFQEPRLTVTYTELTGYSDALISSEVLRPNYGLRTSTLAPATLDSATPTGSKEHITFVHFADPYRGLADYTLRVDGDTNHITTHDYDSYGRLTRTTTPKGNAGRTYDITTGTLSSADLGLQTAHSTDWEYYGVAETASVPVECTSTGPFGLDFPAVADAVQYGLLKERRRPGIAAQTMVYDERGRELAVTTGKGTICREWGSFDRMIREQGTSALEQQTFAISDGGDDVYTQQNGSVYPPDGNVIVSSTATLNQQARSKNGSNNQVSLGWLRFDTSALPDNAIVTGATLELYQKNVLTDTDSRSLVIDWQDPSIWPIATGDHTNTSPAGDALDLALASVNGDALNSFALTGADTNVDVTGETALTLGVDGGQATGINRIDFATLEHSVFQEPRLTVTYGTTTDPITYEYDPAGHIRKIAQGTLTTETQFDETGRTLLTIDSFGAQSAFVYDLDGNIVTETDTPVVGGSSYTTTHSYDDSGTRTSTTTPANETFSFEYDDVGQLRGTIYPNGTYTCFAYNDVGWTKAIRHVAGTPSAIFAEDCSGLSGSILAGYDYEHKPHEATPGDHFDLEAYFGKITRQTRFGTGLTTEEESFTYDAIGRLSSYTDPASATTVYCYDLNSNRVAIRGLSTQCGDAVGKSEEATYDQQDPDSPGLDQLTHYRKGNTDIYYTYSSDGEVVERDIEGDVSVLEWDEWSRLSGVTTSAGAVDYTFDPAGFRRQRVSQGITTQYRLGGTYETDGSGSVTSSASVGPYGDLARYPGPPVSPTTPEYAYYNAHGDLVLTADATGQRIAAFTYAPFGEPNDSTPANATTERWAASANKKLDTSTNLIEMGARPYDPSIGRFYAVDSITGGSLNLYDYAGQDPVNNSDPDGTICVSPVNTAKDLVNFLGKFFGKKRNTINATCAEVKWCDPFISFFWQNPFYHRQAVCARAAKLASGADRYAKLWSEILIFEDLPGDPSQHQIADALRHCFFAGYLAHSKITRKFAQGLLDRHEEGTGAGADETATDVANNRLGLIIGRLKRGQKAHTIRSACVGLIRNGHLRFSEANR